MLVEASTAEGEFGIEVLRGIGLFGALNDSALELVRDKLQPVDLQRDEQLFAQGDAGRALFVVLHGEMRLTQARKDAAPDEAPVVLGRYLHGEWFGERAIMDVMPRSYTATAILPSRLLKMRACDCDALYRHCSKAYSLFMMNIARQLSRKLRVLQQRL